MDYEELNCFPDVQCGLRENERGFNVNTMQSPAYTDKMIVPKHNTLKARLCIDAEW